MNRTDKIIDQVETETGLHLTNDKMLKDFVVKVIEKAAWERHISIVRAYFRESADSAEKSKLNKWLNEEV